ncbi:MAG: HAD family hydrolase [Candidatus Woesearchaeota archaeon]
MQKVVVIDFAGTLIREEALHEANMFRSNVLQRSLPTTHEHAHEEELYSNNQQRVEKLTGITAEHNILYTYVTGRQTTLTGEEIQNQIATTLFQIGMYETAKKHKENVFVEGILDVLYELKRRGYSLAIMSGVRTDIISGVLEMTETSDLFEYVLGQPPQLGITNKELLTALQEEADIQYVIGDKSTDLQPAKELEATSIFVTWGTPRGDEEADHTINKPEELLNIIT